MLEARHIIIKIHIHSHHQNKDFRPKSTFCTKTAIFTPKMAKNSEYGQNILMSIAIKKSAF